MVMSLTEWFGDFHEWHLSMNEKEQRQQILIWDQVSGYGYASTQESIEIYRQASMILTLYYNPLTFSQIYPWHHGAGDFVVKREQNNVEVRLTTARKYEPVMVFSEEAQINPMVALIYFFLNLTLQMRLDKQDGTGDILWAEDWMLPPVIEGFLDGLRIKEQQENVLPIGINKLLELLKGFDRKEFQRLLDSLMELHRLKDPEDYRVIRSHLEDHARSLWEALRAERKEHRA